MNDEQFFLDGLRANPEDVGLRLVYADWLEERGDARSEYVRADGELLKLIGPRAPSPRKVAAQVRELRARLDELRPTLDNAWVALVDELRPAYFRCRVCKKAIAGKDAIATNPRTYRKMKSTRYCRTCYEDAVRNQTRQGFSSYDYDARSHRDNYDRDS